MKNIFYCLALSVFFVLPSCAIDDMDEVVEMEEMEEEPDIEPEVSSILYVKSTARNGIPSTAFEYNADNELAKTTLFLASGKQLSSEYFYDNDTIIVMDYATNGALNQIRKNYVVNDTLRRRDAIREGVLKSYSLYIFPPNSNCGIVSIQSFNADNEGRGETKIDFIDMNCSSESSYYDSDGNLSSRDRLIRNDLANKSPWKINEFLGYTNHGYVEEYSALDDNDMPIDSLSYRTEIEYNSAGYLSRVIENYLNGKRDTITYEYY